MTSALEAAPPSAPGAAIAETVAPAIAIATGRPRAFRCRCGRPVFFRNSRCPACGTVLGYDPETGRIWPLEPDGLEGRWRVAGSAAGAPVFWRCANFDSAAGCNWLIESPAGRAPTQPLCRACRLNRSLPDLSRKQHRLWWRRVELAKRTLVASLIGLGLPVASRVGEEPSTGLAFDLLHEDEAHARVVSGYRDGIVTFNIEEADDAKRARVRAALREPCRTLLGQLRHDVGHYYWQRLVAGGGWHEPFRALFGDERRDAAPAPGPPWHESRDWASRHVSAQAALHPLEDWAETFAHYLAMHDTLDIALGLTIAIDAVETRYEPFNETSLYRKAQGDAAAFLALVNRSTELTGVVNELARSLGRPDFYPFVLSSDAVRKLHFVHLVVLNASGLSARNVRPIGGGIAGGSRTGTGLSGGVGS
jgi:hypothetical protein